MCGQPGHNTRPHTRLPPCFPVIDATTGSRPHQWMYLTYFLTRYPWVFVQPGTGRRPVDCSRNKMPVLYSYGSSDASWPVDSVWARHPLTTHVVTTSPSVKITHDSLWSFDTLTISPRYVSDYLGYFRTTAVPECLRPKPDNREMIS